MAGNAKPNIEGLGKEVKMEILESKVEGSPNGLIDGTTVNEWNSERVTYWRDQSDYIIAKIHQPCNIWRAGTTGWIKSNAILMILKKDKDGKFVDITSEIEQISEEVTENEWSKTIIGLKAGIYKFVGTGYHIDSEWYLELTSPIEKTDFSIHKTLKENLPISGDGTRDEMHITEEGEIYVTDKKGKLKQCKTGEIIRTIVNDVSNPLTLSPLEYGYLKFNKKVSNGEDIPIVEHDTNILIDGNSPLLKAGNRYKVTTNLKDCLFNNDSGIIEIDIKVGDNILHKVRQNRVSANSNNVYSGTAINYVSVENDSILKPVMINIAEVDRYILEIIIEEIRTNPVNQYGGFETEVLFDGEITNIGEYTLARSIEGYSFLIFTTYYKSEYIKVLPPMTSNNTPIPLVATANNVYSKDYGVWKAFNQKNENITDCWLASGSGGWIKIDTGAKTEASSVFLSPRSDGASVADFTVDGSNNDVDWETILTHSGGLPIGGKTFEFDSLKSYRYYRLKASSYVNTWTALSRFDLQVSVGEYFMDSIVVLTGDNYVVLNDGSRIIVQGNTVNVTKLNNSISKIIGVRGQLPSLLVGGKF